MIEAKDIEAIAELPTIPETARWRVSIAGHMIIMSSTYAGHFAVVGRRVFRLPQPWDGQSVGYPLPKP